MKSVFLNIIFVCSWAAALAQIGTGHIYGTITDGVDQPIAGASVYLLRGEHNVLLKGTVTNANGHFSLNHLPLSDTLTLKISAIGYKLHEREIYLEKNTAQTFDKDLGRITLLSDDNQLAAVTITARKPLMQMDIDKKTFNVDETIITAGGTAVDIMRYVPSVQVDMDGNITLRNGMPQIYINGKPATLSLDQLPAHLIESVEVITNPSAKYDASGGHAGILNVLLKKSNQKERYGSLQAGLDSRGGFNGGGNFNFRKNKVRLSALLNGNRTIDRLSGITNRRLFTDTSSVDIVNDYLSKTKGTSLLGKIGIDYFVTDRTTLAVSGTRTFRKTNSDERIAVTAGDTHGNRPSNEERQINSTIIDAGLEHRFPNPGEKWTTGLRYTDMLWEGEGLYTSNYFESPKAVSGSVSQKNMVGGHNKLLTAQTDYIKPISESQKLEAGLSVQRTDISNKNENYMRPSGADDFEKIDDATIDYTYTNNVYAAYATYSGNLKDHFGYQLGLRIENSGYKGELLNSGEKFDNSYPASLFPSIFMTKRLKQGQKLQFSASRGIYRPTSFQLTPYTDYTDNLNLTRGNPNLEPEFSFLTELSYSKNFKTGTVLLFSVYYKRINNLITRYLENGENPVTGEETYINTFINANSGASFGAELTSIYTPKSWWDITASINLYNAQINTGDTTYAAQHPLWSVFTKVNNHFKLPGNLTIRLSGDYQSKTNLPINSKQDSGRPRSQGHSSSQGYIDPFFGVDAAIKKTFLADNSASVALSINDIFRSRETDLYSEGPGFTQTYFRLKNPQMIHLEFIWQFGEIDHGG